MVEQLVNTEINRRRIAFVESCFGSAGLPLAVKGRVLVGEGILTKACRKKPKPRQFFLFNDLVVYGNILINKKKYNKQRIIPLEEVKLQSLEDEGQFCNGWLICTRGKSFAVYAATAEEKYDWMSHIQRCIDELLSSSGKKPPDEHAAVWVPDSEARSCMLCNKSHFTVINRRHHCRKCGAVVCGSCSTHRYLLPSQSSKPIRVCDSCYDTLNNASNKYAKNTSISEHKNTDSSGEDESDEDDHTDTRRNEKDSHESYWYDSTSTKIVSGVATLPAITAHDLNLSPLSQISPLPRAASDNK